jgi:hypothetical protein
MFRSNTSEFRQCLAILLLCFAFASSPRRRKHCDGDGDADSYDRGKTDGLPR